MREVKSLEANVLYRWSFETVQTGRISNTVSLMRWRVSYVLIAVIKLSDRSQGNFDFGLPWVELFECSLCSGKDH